MERLLKVSVDGTPVAAGHNNYPSGSTLEASIPVSAFNTPGVFQVVETPIATYETDFVAIRRLDGTEIDLGELPSVTQRGAVRFATQSTEGRIYDFFYLHDETKLDTVRISVGKREIPQRLTLDEMALLVILQSGLTPDQARGVRANVIYDGVHLLNRHQYLHYGLKIGEMVATINTQDPFGLLWAYADTHKDRARFFYPPTRSMFVNEVRRLAGFPPQAS